MSLAAGVGCFRSGFALARRPRLRKYVWLPIVTSLAVVAILTALLLGQIDVLVAWIVDGIPAWLAFIEVVLKPLFYLLTILAGGWLVGLLAIVIASPFLGNLSAGAEQEQFGSGPALETSLAREAVNALRRELRKLRYSLPRLLAVFLISLIPFVSPFAPLLWFVFGAWVMAIQFVDYAPENRGLGFDQTLAALRRQRSSAFGFGAITSLLMAVPFLNVFMIPVAVCGGAVLWRTLNESQPSESG